VTLDLTRIVDQIDAMVRGVDRSQEGERFDALRTAWNELDELDVNTRFTKSRTSFLLARTDRNYRTRHRLPPLPTTYTVAATDGSMILPDRHSPARFYLLNVGKALLRYGDDPKADLTSEPDLRFAEDDLVITSDGRRTAADMIPTIDGPAIALLDGTLILWALQSQDQSIIDQVLGEFLEALWTFKQRNLPVAAYISAPGSADLMNTLRVSICDYPHHGWDINCDHCRKRILTEGHTPACDILPGVPDRYLLEEIAQLRPGERTTVFTSNSKILERYGDELRICFFYLHAGREIARIEIPHWIATDQDALDLVHGVIYDQCILGRGYPVALQEAHEMAVLSMADRRLVEEVIERRLAAIGIVMTRTGKDGSKRGRFV
jgi:hypothetical protein